MPSPGTPSQGDGPSGKAAGGSDSPWSFVLEASPALFPNRAGTIESRAERARDGRRAAIRTVGRAEALSTLSAMSRSLRREAGAPVSSSSSDASEDDLLQTTRERGTLRELLLSKSTSAGGAVGRETGETPPLTARLTEPLERSVERAPRGKQDTAEDTAGTTTGPTKMNAEGSFSASPSPSMRAPANSASGTPSAAPTPSRFSSSLAAQKRMHHDLLSEAARRRLEVKLQVVEEPPILVTPVQRKYIMRWVDMHRGTLRSVADVALAALKKARTDKAYAARVHAENERARLARLERLRGQLADFRRSDPRARWKNACDALLFVAYVKRLVTLSRKADATSAVRRQRLERDAEARVAAEAMEEAPSLRSQGERTEAPSLRGANDGDVSLANLSNDPVALRDAERARLASSLVATKRAIDSRFGSATGEDIHDAPDDDDGLGFEPKLGQANAAALSAKKAAGDMGEKEYRELSYALKEQEKREALERIGKAQQEFHWRPVTRVRLAHALPLELFLDDDAQYDEAVLLAGKTLRDAGVLATGTRAGARAGSRSDGGGEETEKHALGVSGDFGVKEKPDERTRNGEARDESASGKARASATDEEAARAVALERRRRAARLAAAYDANLAASRASSFAGTERAFASVSGKLSLGNRGFRESRAEDEETAGVVGARAGSGARPPMRFGAADAHERRRDMSVAETATRRARAKQYGKWYVPASARDAAAYAARERRWAEKRGGALAAEVKALKARESQTAAKNQRSYAARIYKSWLDARLGANARVPSYMRDVEAQEDGTWWEASSRELVRAANERLARSH